MSRTFGYMEYWGRSGLLVSRTRIAEHEVHVRLSVPPNPANWKEEDLDVHVLLDSRGEVEKAGSRRALNQCRTTGHLASANSAWLSRVDQARPRPNRLLS